MRKAQTLYHATLETSNYSFDAYGASQGAALRALEAGWAEHVRQTGATMSWAEVEPDAQVRAVRLGSCWRDRQRLTTDTGEPWPKMVIPD